MSFFPPVQFVVEVIAGPAIAGFEKVNAELTKLQANSIKTGMALDGISNKAMLAKGAFVALGVAAAAFGAYAVHASMDNEVSNAKLETSLKNIGDTSKETYDQINNLANSMVNLGFSDNVVMDSLTILITATGNATDAIHLNALAMDLARRKHIPLAEAAATLAKGTQGNARAFKEFGITLDNSLPKQEAVNKALTELQSRLGGSAQAYAKTLAGKIEILHMKFELMSENIGNVLIPILSKFIDAIFLAGKVIGAVFGPVVRFIDDNRTAFIALATGVMVFYGALKTTSALVFVYQAVQKAYVALIWAQVAGTNALSASLQKLKLAFLSNPIGAIVAILMALGAAFVYAWNNSIKFREIVINALQLIVKGFGYLTGAFQKGFEYLSKIPLLGKIFKPISDGMKENIKDYAKWGDSFENLKNKKITLPSWLGGGSTPNTSRTDPFNLDNYTGAGATVKDKLAPLLEKVKSAYDDMNKVIVDFYNKRIELQKAALERETAAQDSYNNTLFNLNRSSKDDLFKLDRDYQDKKDILYRSYEESLASAQKNYDDSYKKEIITHNDNVLKIQQDYEQKSIDITKTYADKKASIVQKSIEVLTSAFASSASLDLGSLFSASFTDENKLTTTLLNQVKNGVSASVSWWGTMASTGVSGLLKDLTTKLNSAKTLSDNAAKLAAQGYSQTFIASIISQGSSIGNQMADAILSASPEAQGQLKDLYAQIQTVSETGVTALATQMNSGAKLATTALTSEYAQAGLDLQEALKDNATSLNKALADENVRFTTSLADSLKTLNDAKDSAALTLKNGLADSKKTYNDSLFDMKTTLDNALFDANKSLKDALAASQKQFADDIDTAAKDTMARLAELQLALKKTAEDIAKISGAKAGVSVMASSPASDYFAGTQTLTSPTNAPTQAALGGQVINIKQQITNQTPDANATLVATISAIKYGISVSPSTALSLARFS